MINLQIKQLITFEKLQQAVFQKNVVYYIFVNQLHLLALDFTLIIDRNRFYNTWKTKWTT